MSKKWLIGASLFATASIFGQDGFDSQNSSNSYETNTSPAPVYAPAPVAAPAMAPVAMGSANFDKIRGNAYNIFGNEAAASTVDDFYSTPHSVFGNRLVYMEPVTEKGFVSFGGNSSTYFVGLDNSADLGQLLVGMGTQNLGFTVAMALGKYSETSKATVGTTTTETTTSIVEQGDYLGATFSMGLGANEFTVGAEWFTFADQTSVKTSSELVASNYDFNLLATFGNGPSAKELAWTAELAIKRHNESVEVGSNTAISPNNHIEVVPGVNLGSKILGNARSRVFLGLSAQLPIRLYDNIKDDRESAMQVALLVAPNILGELALTENWLVFGGAGHSINLATYGGYTDINGTNKTENSFLQTHSYASQVNMGMRYQKDNYAIEASLADKVFSDGTNAIFNSNNVLATFGGFIYF